MDTQQQGTPAVDPLLDSLDMFEFQRILAERNIKTPDELRDALDHPYLFKERTMDRSIRRILSQAQ